jgi:hypothetical protein
MTLVAEPQSKSQTSAKHAESEVPRGSDHPWEIEPWRYLRLGVVRSVTILEHVDVAGIGLSSEGMMEV